MGCEFRVLGYRVVIFVALVFSSFSLFAQTNSKPNIIYIYADDLGYGELGCYGQTKIKTPHIDQLAKEGIRFTQHYSSAPVCAPSRCMLMTGKNPGHSYIRGNYEMGGFEDETERGQMPLHDGAYTIAKMLKERNYATAMIGKWGMGVVRTTGSPLNHGFDYYYGYLDQKQAHNFYPTHLWENDRWDSLNNPFIYVHKPLDSTTATDKDFDYYKGKDYAPQKMTEKALAFIEKNKSNSFFLYLPYTIPHLSLQLPDEYVNKYKGVFDDHPYYGQKGYAANKFPLATYAGMISYLDDQVGILLEKIKALGLDENTIIMFSSDNGTTFSAPVDKNFFNSVSGLRGLKMELYEGGIRVPFIARWPGKIKAGSTSDLVSVQYDMMATLAAITGAPVQHTDGISLLPTLTATQKQEQHSYLYFEYPENGGQVAVRMGNWKGIKKNLIKQPIASWELYDLSNDPKEQNNVAASHKDILKQFDAIVKKEHQHPVVNDWEVVDRVK
jgi:arylsulfatase A-like enzyme